MFRYKSGNPTFPPVTAGIILQVFIWGCSHLPGEGGDEFKIVVYRDTWGVPHIYAPTADTGSYAMGWAQAEDRPEALLKNFLRGLGEAASVEGESEFQSDLIARTWDHYGTARRHIEAVDEENRSYLSAFVRGINDYYDSHPEDVPEWWGDRKVDEPMVIAFGRHFLFSWSIDQGFGDLYRAGLRPGFEPESRGSNQLAVARNRSAEGVPILIIDPHLSWWGASRFWEFRIHAGKLRGSGVTLAGFPAIGLGHNEKMAWAMTTGGPDTADIYELKLNGRNPTHYLYDGEWRALVSRQVSIQVKGEPEPRQVPILESHFGPLVALTERTAYALKMAYSEEVDLLEPWFRLAYAEDYRGAVQATESLRIFPQNIMVADTSGNIYYQRTGRVPRRPEGYDWSQPVDGSTSNSEWLGFHSAKDLVQVLNPEQGYMQNCNIPPDVMMLNSPVTPDRYPPYIYSDASYGPRGGWSNSRGARAVELLAADQSVTAEEAIDYILDVKVYGAERWIDFLRQAAEHSPVQSTGELRVALEEVLGWDGRLESESSAAVKYYYWQKQLAEDFKTGGYSELRKQIDNYLASIGKERPPTEFREDQLAKAVQSFQAAMEELRNDHGSLNQRYGDIFRVGRDEKSWPVGGGGSGRLGLTTLRNVSFGETRSDRTQWGRHGQTATQVVVLGNPIRSWSAVPIGQSDRPDSTHYRDQAEKLFSPRQLKPTWWRPEELADHIETRTVLSGGGADLRNPSS